MSSKPVARLGDACVSPTGKSGRITTASSRVYSEDLGVARVGDTVTYVDGTTTLIATGAVGSRAEDDRPIARVGDQLADGGRIVQGSPGFFVGEPYPGAGSVSERTVAAARMAGRAFVRPGCAAREAAALAAAEEMVDEPARRPVLRRPAVALDRDLADGGAPALHGGDAAAPGGPAAGGVAS